MLFFSGPWKVVEIIKIDDAAIITISSRKLGKLLGLLFYLFTDSNPQICYPSFI
jgi:hypothetical protein